jgi:hypothetical protein
MNAGDLLIEARQQVRHGYWLKWLADHCGMTVRTAQRYMRLARNRASIEAKYDSMSHLTVDGALALLTVPRETDDLLVSFTSKIDAQEALRRQAETARREVILDQVQCNLAAIEKIHDQLGIDRSEPATEAAKKICDEIIGDWGNLPADIGARYEQAVESDDFDLAFALVEWAHGFSVDVLDMAKEIAMFNRTTLKGMDA